MSGALKIDVYIGRQHAAYAAQLFEALTRAFVGDSGVPDLDARVGVRVEDRADSHADVDWNVSGLVFREDWRRVETRLQMVIDEALPKPDAAPPVKIELEPDAARYVGRILRKWLLDFESVPFHVEMLHEVENATRSAQETIAQIEAQGVALALAESAAHP